MKKRTQLFSTIGMLTLLTVALMGTADASSNTQRNEWREMEGSQQNNPIHQAIESGDYQAFLSAKQKVGYGIATIDISEAQFKKLIEAQSLRKQGKFVEADRLLEESGIKKPTRNMQPRGLRSFQSSLTESQKKAFDQARTLRKEGRFDEARKVLTDAGISMVKK